jgi:ketosteroid isomerase-like protein
MADRMPLQIVRAHYDAIRREVPQFAVDRMIQDGDTVVVLGHERLRVPATGREWNTGWVQVHTVRDGAICRFREYTDTAAIAAAFG